MIISERVWLRVQPLLENLLLVYFICCPKLTRLNFPDAGSVLGAAPVFKLHFLSVWRHLWFSCIIIHRSLQFGNVPLNSPPRHHHHHHRQTQAEDTRRTQIAHVVKRHQPFFVVAHDPLERCGSLGRLKPSWDDWWLAPARKPHRRVLVC